MTSPKPLWEGKPSQITNLLPVGSQLFTALALGFGNQAVLGNNMDFQPIADRLNMAIAIAFSLFAVYRIFYVKTHTYSISQNELQEGSGVFNRDIHTVELFRVKDFSVSKPLFLRLFGLGNLIIHTSDHSTPLITLRGIPKPEKVMAGLRKLVDRAREKKGVREFD